MAINEQHPQYSDIKAKLEKVEDAYEGEEQIKSKGTLYLPAAESHQLDGMESGQPGLKNYSAYLARTIFPDYVADAVEMAIGMMWQRDPVINLPEQMKDLLEVATLEGEGLKDLLRRINEKQLVSGRLGLMMDLPTEPANPAAVMPYIALYEGLSIINWNDSSKVDKDDTLNLVVLCETQPEIDAQFVWKDVEQYRVLKIVDDVDVTMSATLKVGQYMQGLYKEGENNFEYNATEMMVPVYRGAPLEEIPFVFVNSKDNIVEPDNPPLLGLANLCLAIYRLEADYRQTLHMQGQDTLVIKGGLEAEDGDGTTRVGSGSKIEVDSDGDAKFIGVSSLGLTEQRQAIENDRSLAQTKTVQTKQENKGEEESGRSRKIRIAAETANLNQIALAGAAGLERILKMIARWIGAPEDQVEILPNLEFADVEIDGQSLVEIMTAKTMGLPISLQSIHKYITNKGLTEKTFEEEYDAMGDEEDLLPTVITRTPAGDAGVADPAIRDGLDGIELDNKALSGDKVNDNKIGEQDGTEE